jgi:hypothetical protein
LLQLRYFSTFDGSKENDMQRILEVLFIQKNSFDFNDNLCRQKITTFIIDIHRCIEQIGFLWFYLINDI